jgi:glycosyltransferase involved in cell wall biosynthesis
MTKNIYPFKVSVSIITYNQAEFIEKAVDSVLAQNTDFSYEIIIGDDCSTDGSREILLDYQERYPELIKLHMHKERGEGIAGWKNNITNIESAQGKYLAFLDGDDYWMSEDKLQKQVAFMDAHPEYTLCFHDSFFDDVNDSQKGYFISERYFSLRKDNTLTISDFLKKNLVAPSSSTLYRRDDILPLPDWFWEVYMADYFLELLATQKGPAKYIKSIKSCQLRNSQSVSKKYDLEDFYKRVRKNDNGVIKKYFPAAEKYLVHYMVQYHYRKTMIAFGKREYSAAVANLGKCMRQYATNTLRCILSSVQVKLWKVYNR